ncbi:MAG: tRNA 4-thiouridine(8) synthase ThiI [Mycoplasmatales bacterium]|nr:tRNA 4-thiouridine(8) synthase ThiI [Mycoplasmatales bacterium]
MYSDILIRFGELSTKGKNKMRFVRYLGKNIKRLMEVKPLIEFDRMYLPFSEENISGLKNIFGIHSFSPVVKTATNEDEIKNTILKLIENKNGKTFKVVVKRHWKGYNDSSMGFASKLGDFILENSNYKVDVKNPDFRVEIEIRENFTYVFIDRINGLGGYPTGINGKVLHAISGGIDSPVAAFEMMKRGIHVDYINFVTPPFTDDITNKKIDKLLNLLVKYQGETKLYRSNYTDLMNYIGLVSKPSFKIILMRRSFYRIISQIAKDENYLGISNGENLGQVASQTLESMRVIQNVAKLPIYRPLITADKLETVDKAEKIGTYKISIERANETCELFAPKNPVIKPKIWEAEKLEKELEELERFETLNIKENIQINKFTY